jgi:GNAT superfamily N-acetyltransferase
MNIRQATHGDLEDLTWVLVASYPSDPIYPYRFPNRHLYPEDFVVHCRLKCEEYLDTSTVHVYECPTINDPEKRRVVAFSVWDLQQPLQPGPLSSHHEKSKKKGDSPLMHHRQQNADADSPTLANDATQTRSARRDANFERMDAFRDACAAAKAGLFDSRYTRGHLFLKVLLCHPDYRRRGIGSKLLIRGILRAAYDNLYTTLFSSPMGYPLYQKLGFKEVGKFRVQAKGEDDFLDMPALVLRPLRVRH